MVDLQIAQLGDDYYINRMDLIDWIQSGCDTFPEGLPQEVLKRLERELTAFGEADAGNAEKGEILPCYLKFEMDGDLIKIHTAVDPENGVFFRIDSLFDFLNTFYQHCKRNVKNLPKELQDTADEQIHDSIYSIIETIKDIIKQMIGQEINWSPK